ncbi:MAG: CRISPR-associated endonuclease Cas2 [Blastomonas sp.]
MDSYRPPCSRWRNAVKLHEEAHLSGYRLMWILVMFDLPVGTKEESRAATKFREYLLDEGFEMSQFSIYARFCSGKEQYEAYIRCIERNLPDKGDVHILGFTDRQYENIIRFNGQSRRRQRRNPGQLALF